MAKQHKTTVWAQVFLCEEDRNRIRNFFAIKHGIATRFIVKNMHITVYHARRPIPGLADTEQTIHLALPVAETRFMVMAPGGENPRHDLEPAGRKVGIRVQKKSAAYESIQGLRARLLPFETDIVLGKRRPSTRVRNAFGARHFQPHMTLLRAGSGIDRNLRTVGTDFRETFDSFRFERFSVEIVQRK